MNYSEVLCLSVGQEWDNSASAFIMYEFFLKFMCVYTLVTLHICEGLLLPTHWIAHA